MRAGEHAMDTNKRGKRKIEKKQTGHHQKYADQGNRTRELGNQKTLPYHCAN